METLVKAMLKFVSMECGGGGGHVHEKMGHCGCRSGLLPVRILSQWYAWKKILYNYYSIFFAFTIILHINVVVVVCKYILFI